MLHRLSLAVALLALPTSCSTPSTQQRPTPIARSFDVQLFADVIECCTSCRGISLSVRNPTDAPVVLDLSRSYFTHNRTPVALTFDDADALIAIAPHTSWRGTLRPPAGAPNPASLKEGRFRNGHYRITLSVLDDERATSGDAEFASVDLNLDDSATRADREGHELPERCSRPDGDRSTRGRPTGWPEPTAGAPAD
jgi:hypothetical protein